LPPPPWVHDLGHLVEVAYIKQHGQLAKVAVLMNPAAFQPPQHAGHVGVAIDTCSQCLAAVRVNVTVLARDDLQPNLFGLAAFWTFSEIRLFVLNAVLFAKHCFQIHAFHDRAFRCCVSIRRNRAFLESSARSVDCSRCSTHPRSIASMVSGRAYSAGGQVSVMVAFIIFLFCLAGVL
jgi:hypothetical protein